MEYRLGQPVEFNATIHRDTVSSEAKTQQPWGTDYGYRRVWTRYQGTKMRHGFIVGKRTLIEGDLSTASNSGERASLDNRTYLQAYLVAFALREKPVFVLSNDLTPTDL
jgi:hypothetical protein